MTNISDHDLYHFNKLPNNRGVRLYTVYDNMVIVVLWMCELLLSSVSLN